MRSGWRPRCSSAAVVVYLAMCLPAAAVQPEARALEALIRTYRGSDSESAVRKLASWPEAELRKAASDLFPTVFGGPRPSEADVETVLAAALLHVEAGGQSPHYRAHFALGQALIQARTPSAAPARLRTVWHLLAATFLHARGDLSDARRCLETGIASLGRIPELLLALGAVEETSASPFGEQQDPRLIPILDRSRLMRRPDSRNKRELARRLYEEALKSDEALAEARLRLGWVHHLLGAKERALTELKRAHESGKPEIRYLADVFSGRVTETSSALAEGHYRRAIAELPPGKVASIALAKLLHVGGRREEAQSVLNDAFVGGTSSERFRDPWWDYGFGGVRKLAEWVAEARSGVRVVSSSLPLSARKNPSS